MKNKHIADLLEKMGGLLQLKGDNIFKIKAYYKAADNLRALAEDIETIKNEGRLRQIPGIGETIAAKIVEFLDTGELKSFQKLCSEFPESLLTLSQIPSVGPQKTKRFFDELKIKDISDLKEAICSGKLLTLRGMKQKAIDKISAGIKLIESGELRMNIGMADEISQKFLDPLSKMKDVKQISVAGSLRRGQETIRDIDILIVSSDAQKVMDAFVRLPEVKTIQAQGETKSSILTYQNIQVDLRVVEEKSFGAALLYFTGSKNFNIELRQVAIKKDMKINEYGVFKIKDKKEVSVASKTEEDCLKALGLSYIPPELREDMGEEKLFSSKKVPALIEQKDIKGEVHVHSTYSDGRHTIEQMAKAAQERGYEYLAISDHSEKLKIARGVTPENLLKKKAEIESLNKKLKNFRILFGTEVEIDTEGNLDYNERILSDFDIVIASIHSGFNQTTEQLTNRLVKACQHKYVHIIGHPTGVHLGKRDPYSIDLREVAKAAADHNVYLEINAFPNRLDLNSQNVYFAREHGAKFVINTDSHRYEQMEFIKYGISIARRGWLTKEDVLNTRSLPEFLKALKK